WPWCRGSANTKSRSGFARSEKRRSGKRRRCSGWPREQYDARFRSNTHAALRFCGPFPNETVSFLWPWPLAGRVSTMPVARIGVSLEGPLLKAFDPPVRDAGYRTRSAAFRNLIRPSLARAKLEWGGRAVGTVPVLYRHC